MRKKTLSDHFILGAIELGYKADEQGNIFSPSGRQIGVGQKKKSGHLSVTLKVPGLNARGYQSVLAHRFVAAYHFGPMSLEAECIRHLNDIPDDNRKNNLAPGTRAENRRDIPKERLSAIAKIHSAPSLVARSRKLTNNDIRNLRREREVTGDSYKKLAERYGITTMTAYRAINQQSWKDIA